MKLVREFTSGNNEYILYIFRVALDYCVFYTAMNAAELGYDVSVVIDATRGISETSIATATEEMERSGIKIVDSDKVISNFNC
jgi:nicotinamidase/pyrazinamidase